MNNPPKPPDVRFDSNYSSSLDASTIDSSTVAPLCDQVDTTLRYYFKHLGDYVPNNLYAFVLGEVEPPLLQVVLEYTNGNQSRAAEILGIDRGTLRKKIRQYKLD